LAAVVAYGGQEMQGDAPAVGLYLPDCGGAPGVGRGVGLGGGRGGRGGRGFCAVTGGVERMVADAWIEV
jgi:hypothetical protein